MLWQTLVSMHGRILHGICICPYTTICGERGLCCWVENDLHFRPLLRIILWKVLLNRLSCSWKLESLSRVLKLFALNEGKNNPKPLPSLGDDGATVFTEAVRRDGELCMCILKKMSGTFQSFKKKLVLNALHISEEAIPMLEQWQQQLLLTSSRNSY